ncbi:MAG: PilZ domain-containing protein [Phycisphaeraceae bacterium]|nr:PilZ domain-containing protein [Phycisphaeraceae bacterium]MCB9847422.1 PilZ domain-containing protein [Phycisphaeraceae bacterium]
MSKDYIKTVRMNEAQQRALLGDMDSKSQSVELSRRNEDRSPLHLVDVPVQVTHPDGGIGKFLVCIRNISSGGLAFIHGGFLYPGSKVVVQTPTIWKGVETLTGKVASCRHVNGQSHEIGVQFDKPCDRRRYLTLPGETPLDPDPDVHERNELVGRVLYVDSTPADAKLVAFHLKNSRVTVETASKIQEAIEKVKSVAIDLIMCSSAIENTGEESAIEALRNVGFKGPVVLVTNSGDAGRTDSAADGDLGQVQTLPKPYSPAKLIAVLSACLSETNALGEGPIYSELASNPDAVELVEYYLGYVEELTAQLRQAIENDEYDGALTTCRTLMETGSGYGFTPISTTAKAAVTELSASMSINESISEIQRLLSVCSRIDSKSAPGAKPGEDPGEKMV